MPEPIPVDQPIISVTLTEWLNNYRAEQGATLTHLAESQAAGFARVTTSLEGKADKVDLERLSHELRALAGDVTTLKDWRLRTETAQETVAQHHTRSEKMLEHRVEFISAVAAVAFVIVSFLPHFH